jgi:RHS repeat-associated protein
MQPVLRIARAFVLRLTLFALLAQALIPPGTASSLALAPAAPSAPALEQLPAPPLMPVLSTGAPAPQYVTPKPGAPITVPLPISVTLSIAPAEPVPGQTVTFTLQLFNPNLAPLSGLELQAVVSPTLHAPEGLPGQYYDPARRLITATLPTLLPRTTITRAYRARLAGVPEGERLAQAVYVVQRSTGALAMASADLPVRNLATSTFVGPTGGTLLSYDGRVRVDFPPGALTVTAQITHHWAMLGDLWPQRPGRFMRFTLDATDLATGRPIHTFSVPVSLTLTLDGLIPAGESFTLRNFDEASGRWQPVARGLTLDPQTGRVQLALTHFSGFDGGSDENMNKGWQLLFNDAQVSLFSGGAAFAYPIDVPPGRAGLAPKLALEYNSRRVDGILSWSQSDWAGLGWTIDPPQIVREVKPGQDWLYGWATYEPKYTLILNGASYELIPTTGDDQYYGRYATKTEDFLYVERRNARWGGSAANDTTEYWVVRTKDGTEYRFGYNNDSAQFFSTCYYRYSTSGCIGNWTGENQPPLNRWYAGEWARKIVYRWRLDQVSDRSSNLITYSYVKHADTTNPPVRDYASYLDRVEYGHLAGGHWGYAVVFNRATRSAAGDLGDGDTDWVTTGNSAFWLPWFQTEYLHDIQVRAYDPTLGDQLVRRYDLSYQRIYNPESGASDFVGRVLYRITPVGKDGTSTLPPSTFSYSTDWNKGKDFSGCMCWSDESFPYARLTQIDNGYGGQVSLEYETPDRIDQHNWWQAWNYRVTTKVLASVLGDATRTAYTYSGLTNNNTAAPHWCYDPLEGGEPDEVCEYWSWTADNWAPGGHLVGYRDVTETLTTPDGGTTLSVITHTFRLNTVQDPSRALGRELETRVKPQANSAWLSRTAYTYSDRTPSLPCGYTGSHFIYLQAANSWTRDGGASYEQHTRTEYDYDACGNPILESHLGDLSTSADDTIVQRSFLIPTGSIGISQWLVDRMSWERVFPGGVALTPGNERALTALAYDNAALFDTALPTQGRLTRQAVYHTISASYNDPALRYEAVFGYDSYGNVTSTNGYIGATTTTYDTLRNTYPEFVTRVGETSNETTTTVWDQRTGLPTQVYGPDGTATATFIYYDAFGRAVKVAEPGDNETSPTIEWVYTCTVCLPTPLQPGLQIEVRRRVSGSEVRSDFSFYDGLGRLQQTRAPYLSGQQSVQNVIYDARGQVTWQFAPAAEGYADYFSRVPGVWDQRPATRATYDTLGRPLTQTGTDNQVTTFAYRGLATGALDPNGHQRVSIADLFGRLVTIKEYSGTYGSINFDATAYATTAYAYDAIGNLTNVTDALGRQTNMTYDALARKITMTDPDMGWWSYGYDPAGNLTRQTRQTGTASYRSTCFYYDALNRLTGKRNTAGTTCPTSGPFAAEYAYGQGGHGYAAGLRTAMTNTAAIVNWTYDTRGRVTAETRAVTGMGTYGLRYTYDSANRLVATTYPNGETVNTTYGNDWQPATLSSSWTSYVNDAQYNVRGQPTRVGHGTGGTSAVRTLYTYDEGTNPSYRLTELHVQYDNGGQTSYLRLQYGYDNAGNLTSLTDLTNSSQEQCFQYDALNRLTAAWTQAAGVCTSYAKVGVGYYNHTGTNNYQYDLTGNITSLAGRSYVYDVNHPQAARYAYNLPSGGRFDDFTVNANGWNLAACWNCVVPYLDGGEPVLRHGGGPGMDYIARSSASLSDGYVTQIEFKASRADADLRLRVEAINNGLQAFGLTATPGQSLRVERIVSGVPTLESFNPPFTLQADTWYVLRIAVGGTSNTFKVYLWQRDNPAVRGYYNLATTPTAWYGLNWTYYSRTNDQAPNGTVVSLDSYFEIPSGGTAWSYAYDQSGDMTARTELGVGYGQTWDDENRLTAVSYGVDQNLSTYNFAYDPDGARVLQTAPSGAQTAYAGPFEETVTPTLTYLDSFTTDWLRPKQPDVISWSPQSGTWQQVNNLYKQTDGAIAEADTYLAGLPANPADVHAAIRVRLDDGNNVLAGIIVRHSPPDGGNNGYFVGLRTDAQGSGGCGIFEKTGGTWVNQTPGASCKFPLNEWHTVGVRLVGGRIDMSVDGVVVATWTDSSPLPTANFGLATFQGKASFDDLTLLDITGTGTRDAFRAYYAFGAGVVAVRDGATAAWGSSAPVYWLHGDHLGSVSLATTASGGQVSGSRAYYYPFGDVRGTAAALPTDLGFTGGRVPAGLGLVLLGARWYDGKLARWASADSIVPDATNPQTLNRFSYGLNNPVKYRDPDGHRPCEACGMGGGGAGGVNPADAFVVTIAVASQPWPGTQWVGDAQGAALGQYIAGDIMGEEAAVTIPIEENPYWLAAQEENYWLAAQEEEQALAGAGGNWPRSGEAFDPDVVQQYPGGCGAACGEMIARSRGIDVAQELLLQRAGAPTDVGTLAGALNQYAPGVEWVGGFPASWSADPADAASAVTQLNRTGPWIAQVWDGVNQPHMVVVNGTTATGGLTISDPAQATSYTMTMGDFIAYWQGYSVYGR